MDPKKISIFKAVFPLFFILCAVKCETVFFTNSQSRLMENAYQADKTGDGLKTYQLDVPGSSPITIIEAEPSKGITINDRYSKVLRNDAEARDYNERRTKDYIVPGSTYETDDIIQLNHSDNCHGDSCIDIANTKKTVYSPDLLNKFLQEYAERIKNADRFTKEKLQQMEITTPRNDFVQKDGNRRYWDEVDTKRHKHPFDDPEGWVALEAVPWSRSKISKWHANTQKVNKPNSNSYGSFIEEEETETHFNDRFPSYGKPDMDNEYQASHHNSYNSPKPSQYDYKKPYTRPSQFDEDIENDAPYNKPTFTKPPKIYLSHNNNRFDHDKRPHKADCDHSDEDEVEVVDGYKRRVSNIYYDKDIIVDDRPNDFPLMSQEYIKSKVNNKRPEEEVSNDHRKFRYPLTHPTNGNGQWVLLSTTKGYKYPKSRERSLSFFPKPLVAHRSIKLTVLPAVNGSKENMTLSHGGMLEVEPSFNTVEESKRIYDRIQEINNNLPNKRKPVGSKNGVIATVPTPDATAVVAAVGAGLVPATVAMIMPMVLGRKKRSVNKFVSFVGIQNVTQIPHLDYESTLQKTLK